MVDPRSGPFLFDTSADSYLVRRCSLAERFWIEAYVERFPVHLSVLTVVERMRGYGLVVARCEPERRLVIEDERSVFLDRLQAGPGSVLPFTLEMGLVASELMVSAAAPPTSPKRTHRIKESRQDRLVRWRFDIMIAATALVTRMPLVHNNNADFDSIQRTVARLSSALRPLTLISVKELTS